MLPPTAAPRSDRAAAGQLPETHGGLPARSVADLPTPPPFGLRNALRVIGPGAIMAATSIGGGEWLVGPAAAVRYSSSIWREAGLLACVGFYAFFAFFVVRDLWRGL